MLTCLIDQDETEVAGELIRMAQIVRRHHKRKKLVVSLPTLPPTTTTTDEENTHHKKISDYPGGNSTDPDYQPLTRRRYSNED
jgi:hypothetical protein